MVKKVFWLLSLIVFQLCAFQASSSSAKASGSTVDIAEDAATTGLTHASVDYSALDDLGDLADQLAQLSVVTEAGKLRDGAIAPSPTSPKGVEILKAMEALVVTTKQRLVKQRLVKPELVTPAVEEFELRCKRESGDTVDFYNSPLSPLAKRFSPFDGQDGAVDRDEKENSSGDSGSTDDSASEA